MTIQRTSVCLMLILMLHGCAGGSTPTPGLTPADISQADQLGQNDEMYRKVTTRLDAGDLNENEKLRLTQIQRDLGAKLASEMTEQVQRTLAETPSALPDSGPDPGLLPEATLAGLRTQIEPMSRWSEPAYRSLSDDLSKRTAATRAAIATRQSQLAATSADNLARRLELLDELTALAGTGSTQAATYAAERQKIMTELDSVAAKAIEAENFEEAERLLSAVAGADPSNVGTQQKLADVSTKVFERNFYQALERGDADKGYELLVSVAATSSFPLIRPRLKSSSDAMANYYVALGSEATKTGNVPIAYERFSQARNIQRLLGDGARRPPPEEAPFIDLLNREFERARNADQMGLAWGYLNVIKELTPESPTLRRELREVQEIVLQRATKRLSVAPFETPDNQNSEFGDAVAAKVVQHLFEAIPNDIRVIEREQLSDIMREKTIEAESGSKKSEGLASADYLIQGTILEAKVDTSEKSGKQTRRVVTETSEQSNPAYGAWLNLSSKDRSKTPEPPKTIMAPRREDVTIEITVHRKAAMFSVSFRVIDAKTAKVAFADSVRATAEHEDTSSEGVELGDFKLEFKLASLPSDSEILTKLADEVSAEIGLKLSQVLADPEKTYRANAERSVEEANYEAAAQDFASAIVLAEQKGQDVEPMLAMLRETSIQCSVR